MSDLKILKTESGQQVVDYGYAKEIIEQQQQRIDDLEQENISQHNLIMRQSEIMTKTANALKGEPEKLSLHSHHDLMDVAHKLARERDELAAHVEKLNKSLIWLAEMVETDFMPNLEDYMELQSHINDVKKLANQPSIIRLAEHDAEVIIQAVNKCKLRVLDGPDIYSDALIEYANQLKRGE